MIQSKINKQNGGYQSTVNLFKGTIALVNEKRKAYNFTHHKS